MSNGVLGLLNFKGMVHWGLNWATIIRPMTVDFIIGGQAGLVTLTGWWALVATAEGTITSTGAHTAENHTKRIHNTAQSLSLR